MISSILNLNVLWKEILEFRSTKGGGWERKTQRAGFFISNESDHRDDDCTHGKSDRSCARYRFDIISQSPNAVGVYKRYINQF